MKQVIFPIGFFVVAMLAIGLLITNVPRKPDSAQLQIPNSATSSADDKRYLVNVPPNEPAGIITSSFRISSEVMNICQRDFHGVFIMSGSRNKISPYNIVCIKANVEYGLRADGRFISEDGTELK